MSKIHLGSFLLSSAMFLAGCIEPETPLLERSVLESTREPALRVQADLARGARWELGWDHVSVFDIASERRLREVTLPGAINSGATCPPDMILARNGALFVSSNSVPRLWRVSPSRFEVEVLDIELDSDREKDFGFTGLAWSVDERILYASSAMTGTLWRIDLATAKASKIELSRPVLGACGLTRVAGAGTRKSPVLGVTIGTAERAQSVHLSPDLAHGEVHVVRATQLAVSK